MNTGVNNISSFSTMTNVTAAAMGVSLNYGMNNVNSSPTMMNVKVKATGGASNYGVTNDNSAPTIHSSTIEGSTNSVRNSSSISLCKIGASQLVGTPLTNGIVKTIKTTQCYDGDFDAIADGTF